MRIISADMTRAFAPKASRPEPLGPGLSRSGRTNSIEDARALGHTFSLGHGLIMGSLTFFLLNDVGACQAVADELSLLAERSKLPWPMAHMEFMRGWLKAQDGDIAAGLDQMLQGANAPTSTAVWTLLLTLIAGQQLRAGHFDAAVATLDRAMNETRCALMRPR
jgi:hypothetical protein